MSGDAQSAETALHMCGKGCVRCAAHDPRDRRDHGHLPRSMCPVCEPSTTIPPVTADPSVPPGVIEFRDGESVVGRAFTPDVVLRLPPAAEVRDV